MTQHTIHPEPPGFSCTPTFVKSNPANNDAYLALFAEHALTDKEAEILTTAHRRIEQLAPGYNIAQLKEKFWSLRFYYDLPENTPEHIQNEISEIVSTTEQRITEEWNKRRNSESS